MPREILELRKLTRADVELKVLRYKQMTQAQLNAIVKDPNSLAEDILIIRVLLKGIATGDTNALGFLTDFIFGSQAKHLKLSGGMTSVVAHIDPSHSIEAIKKLNDEF